LLISLKFVLNYLHVGTFKEDEIPDQRHLKDEEELRYQIQIRPYSTID
jgi:hypothetical protein